MPINSAEILQAITEKGRTSSSTNTDANTSSRGTGTGTTGSSTGMSAASISELQPVPQLNHATLMGLAENLRTGNIILDVILMTIVSALLKFFLDIIRWDNIMFGLKWIRDIIVWLIPRKKPAAKEDAPMNQCLINLEYKTDSQGRVWHENTFVKNNEYYFLAMYRFLSQNAAGMKSAELNITYDSNGSRKPWEIYRNYEVGARPLSTLEINGFFISYSETHIKPNLPTLLEDDGKTENTQKAIREFINANKYTTVQKKIVVESKKSTAQIMKFVDQIYQDYLNKRHPIPPQKPKTDTASIPAPRYYFCRQQCSEESYERYELHVKKTFSTLYFPRKEKLLKRLDRFAAGQTTSGKFTILLHGPPGGGKTSFIKALCNYTQCHVINIKLSQFANLQQLMNIFHREYLWVPEIDERMYIPINKRIYLFEDIDCDNNKIVLKRTEDQEKQIKDYLKKQRRKSNKNKHKSKNKRKNKGKHNEKSKDIDNEKEKGMPNQQIENQQLKNMDSKQTDLKIVKDRKKIVKLNSDDDTTSASGTRKSHKKNHSRSKYSGSSSSDDDDSEQDLYSISSTSESDSIPDIWSNDYSKFYGSFARSKYTRETPTSNPLEAPSLSLAGILNLLDGVLELNGCYIVMTTNYKDKLDRALTRPGRVNYEQELTYMEQPDMYQMIRQYVPKYRGQLRHLGENSEEKMVLVKQIEEKNKTLATTIKTSSADENHQQTNIANQPKSDEGISDDDEEAHIQRRTKLYSSEWEQEQWTEIMQKISEKPELFSITSRTEDKRVRVETSTPDQEPDETDETDQTDDAKITPNRVEIEKINPNDLLKSLIDDVEKWQTMPCMFETICQNEDHILEIIKNMIDNIYDRELERETADIRAKEYEEELRQKREKEKEREKRKAQTYKNYTVGLSKRSYSGKAYCGRNRASKSTWGGTYHYPDAAVGETYWS